MLQSTGTGSEGQSENLTKKSKTKGVIYKIKNMKIQVK
jgi:hypothetical protein